MTSNPQYISLPDYFQTEFLKLRKGLSGSTLRQIRQAVDCFCDWMGCRVPCALVTNATIDAFGQSGARAARTMRGFTSAIRTVMREFDPGQFPKHVKSNHRSLVTHSPTPRTTGGKGNLAMLDYVDRHFFLERKRAGVDLSPRTRRWYRAAVFMLYRFAGKNVTCSDVDDTMLLQFEEWQASEGCSTYSLRQRSMALRAIVRSCYPDRFPIGASQSPCLSFHEAGTKGTLEQIFVDDYLPQRTRIGSGQTVRQYGRCLRLFGEFLERPATLKDLNDKTVGQFLRWLVEPVDGKANRVKPVTANGYVKQIKALWNWAAKKRLVRDFPTIDKLPQAKPVPIAWKRDDLAKLIAASRAREGTVGGVSFASLWVAFHLVQWDSGERTGAMWELRWEWIDWKSGHLSVPGEFRKGRQKPMVYQLKPATLDALGAIREPERELIFDLLLPPWRFYRQYRELVLAAGLPYVKSKTGPQKMRRTYASFIEAAGGNATRALKHVDRRVTEESYLDPRIAETHHENERLFPLDGDAA